MPRPEVSAVWWQILYVPIADFLETADIDTNVTGGVSIRTEAVPAARGRRVHRFGHMAKHEVGPLTAIKATRTITKRTNQQIRSKYD